METMNYGLNEIEKSIRDNVEAMIEKMNKGIRNRVLRIASPNNCPVDLAERIGIHNKAVADFENHRAAWQKNAVQFPSISVEINDAGGVIDGWGDILRLRIELLTENIDLLRRKGEFLSEVIHFLRSQVNDATAALDKAQRKGAADLTKAGAGVTNERCYLHDKAMAERKFSNRVNELEPVRITAENLRIVTEARNRVEADAKSISQDIAFVGAMRFRTVESIVGRL